MVKFLFCFINIKCQGTSSMAYPKKNFSIRTYEDEELSKKFKLNFKAWVDDMIVADDFVTVEPLDCLISFLPNNEGIFWNYNFSRTTEPEIIDGVVIDGSMTWGEAYEVILRFIHNKYEDKDDIFTI